MHDASNLDTSWTVIAPCRLHAAQLSWGPPMAIADHMGGSGRVEAQEGRNEAWSAASASHAIAM
jgi:hypothetical protein